MKKTMMKGEPRTYLAVAKPEGGYTIGIVQRGCTEIQYSDDCQTFATWEDADNEAKAMANSEYDYSAGCYVCNR